MILQFTFEGVKMEGKVGRPRLSVKRVTIALYEETVQKWNIRRNLLGLSHNDFAVLLLEFYDTRSDGEKDEIVDKPMPRLTPIKGVDFDKHIGETSTLFRVKSHCLPLSQLSTTTESENLNTDVSILNESMPFDDLELVTVQDFRKISTLLAEPNTVSSESDLSYLPSDK